MASLYRRTGSKFWWVKYRDPLTGRREQKSTGFRYGIESETRKARQRRDELTMAEGLSNTELHPWREWVEDYLKTRHSDSPNTLKRKLIAWRTIQDFFDERRILGPGQLTREHCMAYFRWRSENGFFQLCKRRKVNPNTALLDIKVLSNVMWEAVHRKYVASNPCQKLELPRKKSAEKSEMTDEQIAFIRSHIAAKLASDDPRERENGDFLHVSFEIALYQGLRVSETHFPLACADLKEMWLRNIRVKGGRCVSIPINPALAPLLQRLRDEGREFPYNPPRMPALNWWKFFNKLRRKMPSLKSVSLHSTRHTLTSRLESAGLPEPVAMKLLSHLSAEVHRTYRRVKQHEIAPFWKKVAFDEPKRDAT